MATKIKVMLADGAGNVKQDFGEMDVEGLFELMGDGGGWEKREVENLVMGDETAFERGTEAWYEVKALN